MPILTAFNAISLLLPTLKAVKMVRRFSFPVRLIDVRFIDGLMIIEIGLKLSFPSYARTIDYDPTLGLTSAAISTANFVPMATVLVMTIASVFTWF
jgi:hypothetical protein